MYKILNKHGQSFALGLGVLVIGIFLITALVGLNSSGYELGTDLNKLGPEAKNDITFFNLGLWITLALIVIGALAWVAFGFFHLVSAPKNSMKFIAGIGVVIVLFVIFYSMSDSETSGNIYRLQQKLGISDGVSKYISGGIKTSLVLLVLAAAFMIVSEIRNFFK